LIIFATDLLTERKCDGPPILGRRVVSEQTELSSVIGDIYDAAIDPTLWKQALANICAYVGSYFASLFWHASTRPDAQVMYQFNDNPHYTQLYFKKYVSMDPFFPASSFLEAGVVHSANEVIPQAELVQTRFYKEWIEPQGIVDAIVVNLEKSGTPRSSFFVIRTDATYGLVDDAMRERMAAIVPHLVRAVTIGRLFDKHKTIHQALTDTLDHVEAAVLPVGADGAIIFTNEAAKQMLDERTLLRKNGDAPHAMTSEIDRALHDIFMSAKPEDASVGVRGFVMQLPSASPQSWFAHVLPLTSGRRQQTGHNLNAAAAVFIRKAAPNAPPPLEAIAKQYNLLPSETRVLAALKMQGVKELAEVLGISQATVKTHLHNLFRKTGTNRQIELMKLVASL
jgi:hypothetical protein